MTVDTNRLRESPARKGDLGSFRLLRTLAGHEVMLTRAIERLLESDCNLLCSCLARSTTNRSGLSMCMSFVYKTRTMAVWPNVHASNYTVLVICYTLRSARHDSVLALFGGWGTGRRCVVGIARFVLR